MIVSAEYALLKATDIPTSIIYGPVASRRMGLSLGVNLSGSVGKACSFDCVYCDLGPTVLRLNQVKKDANFPTPEDVRRDVAAGIRAARDRSEPLTKLCVSGNGEPTLHPDFDLVTDAIIAARNEAWPDLQTAILTNGANADSRRVRAALNKYDDRMVKLDAGNERVFKAINGPLARITLAKTISNARLLRDATVQSLFVRGYIDNSLPADVEEWIEAVALVKPKAVHIIGMNRIPARPGLIALDEDALYTIASKLERRTQIKALVFI